MLDWIASIFKYPMQWFYQLTGDNYLLALILFALFVKVLVLPFSIRQQKTQIKGAKLRPKIAIIEKKYQGQRDPAMLQQKQQEIMELQQKEGYSPLSGCLPLLVQLPVFLGLYQVVRKPLTYLLNISNDAIKKLCDFAAANSGPVSDPENQIPLMDWLINNPGTYNPDNYASVGEFIELPNLTFGPFNLGAVPSISSFDWLLLIPLFSFVFSFLSMKITRKLNSPVMTAQGSPETEMSNKIMDLMMPLMSVFISFTLPAAFGVYWLFGYVFGIIQTVIMAKAMPLPTFTEEELRQYEKEMKASRARSNYRPVSSAPVRSRHHIDDDDDDMPVKPAQKPKQKQSGKAGARTKGVESAPMKDESDKN